MISFEDDFKKGKSIGNIRGEDCQAILFGYALGPAPKLDRAIEHLQRQTQGSDLGVSIGDSAKSGGLAIRYLNDVTTDWDGFNAGIFAKHCLVVKGRGYK